MVACNSYTDIGQEACHHPFVGSYGYYAQDAETFADWEVDYVKFDGCDQPPNTSAQNLTCEMSNALNNTGRAVRVLKFSAAVVGLHH